MMPLTGLNHSGLRQVLGVATQLHANLVRPGVKVGRLLTIVAQIR